MEVKLEVLLGIEPKKLPLLALAFISQAIALVLVIALILPVIEYWTGSLPSLAVALMIGASAAIVGYIAAMPTWWMPINLFFSPIVALSLPLEIPAAAYLVVFLLLAVFYRGVVLDRVPLYFSSKKAGYALLEHLQGHQEIRFIDLGSGLGSLLIFLAKNKPAGVFFGVESALFPYWLTKIRLRMMRSNCHVTWTNMWNARLSEYDVIYAYLSPEPMLKLLSKLRSEMRPDALFISNTFALPDIRPAQEYDLTDFSRSRLYVYRYDDIMSPTPAA